MRDEDPRKAVVTVPSLAAATLRRALDVVDPDRVREPGAPLPWSLLNGLADLVRADGVSYLEMDPYAGRGLVEQDTEGVVAGEEDEARFWALFWTSPDCCHPERSGDFTSVIRPEDFGTARERAAHPMRAYLREAGVETEMILPLPPHGTVDRRLLFYRHAGGPFHERDALLLALLRPHVVRLHARTAAPAAPSTAQRLTPRQQELLRLVASGCSNTQLARRLHLSEGTVRKHLENIYSRLEVPNRAAAVAVQLGLAG